MISIENRSNNKKKTFILVIIIFGAVFLLGQTTDSALENLAAEIASKRAEVEALSAKLENKKADYNERLRSLSIQHADMEARIKRENLRLAQYERELNEYRKSNSEAGGSQDFLKQLAGRVLLRIRAYINESLPFQKEERISEIDTFENLLVGGNLDEAAILARLWNFVESEFRLATESGIYRQVIERGEETFLAEVIRLGFVFLYYRTRDNEYGYAVKEGGAWKFTSVRNEEEKDQIDRLYDALRKNIREGRFTIPYPGKDL
ncbi:MAG: DUF3450 family protein [Spirochaetales bacterium]|nr:DUF3450 family protein [Spirochaetales bacterium]